MREFITNKIIGKTAGKIVRSALEKVHLYNPDKYTIIWTDLRIMARAVIYGKRRDYLCQITISLY